MRCESIGVCWVTAMKIAGLSLLGLIGCKGGTLPVWGNSLETRELSNKSFRLGKSLRDLKETRAIKRKTDVSKLLDKPDSCRGRTSS